MSKRSPSHSRPARRPRRSRATVPAASGTERHESQPHFHPVRDAAWQRDPASFAAWPDMLALPSLEPWLEGLHVAFVSAVDWHCTPQWQLGPRIVADSMFFVIEAGDAQAGVEDERFDLASGDIMLIPQGASHWVRQRAGTEMRVLTIHLHAQVFGGINALELLGFPARIRPVLPRDLDLLEIPRGLCREYALRAPGFRQNGAAALTRWLLHLIRHCGSQFKPPYTSERIHELRRLLPAFDYIERNLADGAVAVGALAKRVFVSEVQFRKLFRRVAGISPVRCKKPS